MTEMKSIKEQLDQAGEEIREQYKHVRIREFESWDVLFHVMLDIPMEQAWITCAIYDA